jgi:hypothetical protein
MSDSLRGPTPEELVWAKDVLDRILLTGDGLLTEEARIAASPTEHGVAAAACYLTDKELTILGMCFAKILVQAQGTDRHVFSTLLSAALSLLRSAKGNVRVAPVVTGPAEQS